MTVDVDRLARRVRAARLRIEGDLPTTPCREALGIEPDGSLFLKLENQMPTGSFKVRGAFHRLRTLGSEEREAGVVTASTGNHGAAMAFAARELGIRARVVVPETTPADRIRAIERFGVEVRAHGDECGAAELHARELAREEGLTYVSPYNDPDVMAGQGTIGAEIAEQVEELARVYVAVGGGGLAGGLFGGLASGGVRPEIIGCSPEASHAMESSVAAGRVVSVEHRPTLSLATAGELEDGTVTLEPCAAGIDRWMRADEGAIAAAMRRAYECERVLVEGAAGVALACWSADDAARARGNSCVIVCGGNVDVSDLVRVFQGDDR